MTALDTGTEDLRAEIDDGVAVITMNRPDRRNAFSEAMLSALGAVLAQVETDEAVGSVVLTGAGGAFCAGELGDCMDLEVTHHVHTALTEDHREAARAFVDKREPRFHGR